MNGLIVCEFITSVAHFSDLSVSAFFFLTEYDVNLPHTGRVVEGIVSFKQEPGEVKWCCLL